MLFSLFGGAIIGIAVSLMLIFNGRVTGISGIVAGAFKKNKNDFSWRILFVLGLMAGGFLLRLIHPASFESSSQNMTYLDYAVAGLLVGFGTVLGNGCTSGHGVCGLSRLSKRSFIATITFISFGILSVHLFKYLRGAL